MGDQPWKAGVHSCSTLVFLSTVTLFFSGCEGPSVQHVHWTALEKADVEQAFIEPTGLIQGEIPEDVLAQIGQVLPGLMETARFIGHLSYVLEEVSNADHLEEERQLGDGSAGPKASKEDRWGTSLYLKLACPGDALLPPYDFENGEVRIDSPEIRGLNLGELLTNGEFLLSFDQCELGPVMVDTAFPGMYMRDLSSIGIGVPRTDPDSPDFGLALDIQAGAPDSALGIVGFACGSSTTNCDSDVRVIAQLDAGSAGTYVLTFRWISSTWLQNTSTSVVVAGANGTSSCTFSAPNSTLSPSSLAFVCQSETD